PAAGLPIPGQRVPQDTRAERRHRDARTGVALSGQRSPGALGAAADAVLRTPRLRPGRCGEYLGTRSVGVLLRRAELPSVNAGAVHPDRLRRCRVAAGEKRESSAGQPRRLIAVPAVGLAGANATARE